MSGYIPDREANLKAFSLNFAALTSAAPAAHGLMAGDAAQIEAAAEGFAAKFDLLQSPATRTSPNVAAKNVAKEALIAILRGYAMQIKNNRAVTSEAKSMLGLAVADAMPTPITAPVTAPMLSIARTAPLRHQLRVADELTPESRARPAGVTGMQLFCHVGTTPPASVQACSFRSLVTRSPQWLFFAEEDTGKTAYYYGRWQTGKGLFGPWSQMARMTIGG